MIFDQEIQEIHRQRQLYNIGKITHEQFMANMRAFDQTHKCMSNKIQAYAVAIKANRTIRGHMERDTLIACGSIPQINSESLELEMIKCPDQGDKMITRAECLDYSGGHESCRTCEADKTTKRLLLGDGGAQ